MVGVLGGITGLFGQDASLQQIKGLPTEEVYDLLADSRGFVWAGHSLGVSRFNGLSFENYSSPEETSSGGWRCNLGRWRKTGSSRSSAG
jgi:ligand-binding sensor domain-containing protein